MLIPVRTGGRHLDAGSAYSWSLSDIIETGLFKFLFSEDDIGTANLGGLVNDVEEWLTSGPPDAPRLRTTDDAPQTFQDMLDWFKKGKPSKDFFGDYQGSTKGSFYRRLKYIVLEGNGVLRRNDPKGKPIRIPEKGQTAPWVIDLLLSVNITFTVFVLSCALVDSIVSKRLRAAVTVSCRPSAASA